MVYFPDLNHLGLNLFREKYDPTYQFIREHLPVLMPIRDTINEETLWMHLSSILNHWSPFDIHLQGLFKSWDHWLFLGVKEGYYQIVKLHDEIYTDKLKPYLREDIPFKPHIGLGLFTSDEYTHFDPRQVRLEKDKYDKAYQEAEILHLDFWCTIDSFDLIMFNDSLTHLILKEKFILTHK